MLHTIKSKLKVFFGKDVSYHKIKTSLQLEKLGSTYGGWTIPVTLLNESSICYLAGAGEDISFDIELANRFNCHVLIYDPTPKSKIHFEEVFTTSRKRKSMTYSNGTYIFKDDTIDRLHFHEIGIWTRNDKIKFFAPKLDEHVSHSISNLQHTDKYFEARVDRLFNLMRSNGHNHIDILKIDIEGSEFEVIDTIIDDKLDVKILCVEFHQSDEKGIADIQKTITKLEHADYRVVSREDWDFTLLKSYLII